MKGVSSSLSRMKTNFPRFLSYFDMQIFLYFSVIICSSCFWSVTPVLVNLAFCCGLRTTLTPRATSAPLVSISRLEPLNWTAKPSSCRSGILLAKKDSEQSHPGTAFQELPLIVQLFLCAMCIISAQKKMHGINMECRILFVISNTSCIHHDGRWIHLQDSSLHTLLDLRRISGQK